MAPTILKITSTTITSIGLTGGTTYYIFTSSSSGAGYTLKTSFTPPAGADKTGLQQLIATKSFPQFEQREAYTIKADQELWDEIRTFLDKSEKKPDGVERIYDIFGGLKWFEEDPAAANLRNILDACISLWKFRTLNPVAEVHAAAT
jgi:hypothetical protein